jgi:hypothetical protein
MEVSDQLHAPAALTPDKEPRYPLDKRLGRSGRCEKRKIFYSQESTPGRPDIPNPEETWVAVIPLTVLYSRQQ